MNNKVNNPEVNVSKTINMKKGILKVLKKSSYLAMFVAVMSANTTCTWIVHQPSMPKDLKKLKKI